MPNRIIPYNPMLKEYARKLRKQSTLSEVLLWQQIKNKALGIEFHRQIPIDNYIVDFYCHELMLAIEIDGSSHDNDEVFKNDVKRQERLEFLGVHFIPFHDLTVKKSMICILEALQYKIQQLKGIV